ncbi:MAG: sensor histidine kinase [Cellulomonadaceae bacterium]|jgi:signal transduction histidine kinase|nr:sensor histidine kinase [Cellulomonadaceae bacterium]
MRRRILLATIAAVAVAVLLLGVPLAIFGARYVSEASQQRLHDRLDRLVASVQAAQERQETRPPPAAVDRAMTGRAGDTPAYVTIVMPDSTITRGGAHIEGPHTTVGAITGHGASVSMTISNWDGWIQSAQLVTLVMAVGVVAVAAGVTIAVWQANRLSAPLVYLAASAEQLASGQVRPRLAPVGVEEIDLVADELARTSDRLAGRIAAERQFTADASHQLRTPLTALTMRLEEIELMSSEDDVREEARISLEQVERLKGVIDDLLAASHRNQTGATEPVDVQTIMDQQMDEWGPSYQAADRAIELHIPEGTRVMATPGAFSQVMATFLENSLKHGAGTTTIRARKSGSRSIAIEVGDEGAGVPEELASTIFERGVTSGNGTGLGLSLARDLAAVDGGRVDLLQKKPAVFVVFLSAVPKGLDPSSVLPEGVVVGNAPRGRRGRKHKGDSA